MRAHTRATDDSVPRMMPDQRIDDDMTPPMSGLLSAGLFRVHNEVRSSRSRVSPDLVPSIGTAESHGLFRILPSPDEKLSCDHVRARKREEAAERRQKYWGDACDPRHNTDLSPPSGAFILLPCSPWGSRPRLRICRASGASVECHDVLHSSATICPPRGGVRWPRPTDIS